MTHGSTRRPSKLAALLLLIGSLTIAAALPAAAATVTTQYPDYAPGDTVVITGSGWEPGETVVLQLHEDPILCPDRTFIAVADENGDILNDQFIVDDHAIG